MKKLVLATAMLLPQVALAHPDPHDAGQFVAGLGHPVGGADHLLAMVALGLLAARTRGWALWALPVAFVGAMIVGRLAGHGGPPLPGTEPMILASVIVFGVLVATAARLPLTALVPGAALFGLTHGWAHGAEDPLQGQEVYTMGLAIATMAIHLCGIGIGRLVERGTLLRGLGGGTAVAGLVLAMVG